MKSILISIDSFIASLFSRIKQSTYIPEPNAAIFRWFFGLFLLLFATPFYQWLETIPDSLYYPPRLSAGRFFSGFLNFPYLSIIDILIVLCCVGITIGFYARWMGFTFLALYFFANTFAFGFGKIDHIILLPLTLLCCSFSNWGIVYAYKPDKKMPFHNASLGILGIFISFGMFTAGFEKLLIWVDFDTSTNGFLNWFYSGYFGYGRQLLLAEWVFYLPRVVTEAMDYLAVAFELSAFLWLLGGAFSWRIWLLAACAFHLTNTLLLNIPFYIHVPVFIAFSFSYLHVQVHHSSIKILTVITLLLGLAHIITRMLGRGGHFLLMNAIDLEWIIYVSMALWSSALVFSVLTLFGKTD